MAKQRKNRIGIYSLQWVRKAFRTDSDALLLLDIANLQLMVDAMQSDGVHLFGDGLVEEKAGSPQ